MVKKSKESNSAFTIITGPTVHYDELEFSGVPRQSGEGKRRPPSKNSADAAAVTSRLGFQTEALVPQALRRQVGLTDSLVEAAENFLPVLEEVQAENKQFPKNSFRDPHHATLAHVDERVFPLSKRFLQEYDRATRLNLTRDFDEAWNDGGYYYHIRNIVEAGIGGYNLLQGVNNGFRQSIYQGRERYVLSGAYVIGERGKGRVQLDVATGTKPSLEEFGKKVPLGEFIDNVGTDPWSFFNVKALTSLGISGPNALKEARPCDLSGLQDHAGRIFELTGGEVLPRRIGLIYITSAGVKVFQSILDTAFLLSWSKGLEERINTKPMTRSLKERTINLYTGILKRLK